MLDRYWWGTVKRISPEAPVPVVSLDDTSLAAGGAANVAANIAGLGAQPYLVGITGYDEDAALMPKVMEGSGISAFKFFPIGDRKTTVKTRIIAHNQQIARIDQETVIDLSSEDAQRLFNEICPLIETTDVVVISDYGKGFLTSELLQNIIGHSKAHNKQVLVDPKGNDYQKYRGATILTPNQKEAADACRLDIDHPDVVALSGKQLLDDLSLEALVVTRGEKGMTLFYRAKEAEHLMASARNVYNVTGAGDTVIGTLAVALGSGMNFYSSAEIANFAAGLVVESVGTTPITIEMLASEAARQSN